MTIDMPTAQQFTSSLIVCATSAHARLIYPYFNDGQHMHPLMYVRQDIRICLYDLATVNNGVPELMYVPTPFVDGEPTIEHAYHPAEHVLWLAYPSLNDRCIEESVQASVHVAPHVGISLIAQHADHHVEVVVVRPPQILDSPRISDELLAHLTHTGYARHVYHCAQYTQTTCDQRLLQRLLQPSVS